MKIYNFKLMSNKKLMQQLFQNFFILKSLFQI